MVDEVKASLDVGLLPQNFGREGEDTLYHYTAQRFVSLQQIEAINGCPFVFAGNIDYTLEDNSTFFLPDD